MMKKVVLLGATGSIGDSTLSILEAHPDKYALYAVTAHHNLDKLAKICCQFEPEFALVTSDRDVSKLVESLKARQCKTQVLKGSAELKTVVSSSEVHTVVAAIVGAAGLEPTLSAVKAGKRVLLANKESLVMAGKLFMKAVRESGAQLLPVDSEHNAIYQCLPLAVQDLSKVIDIQSHGVKRILLTASGGPFREFTQEQLASVTPDQACKHPNWNMGQKISIDSATLMNKGLELIEACWLFDVSAKQVQVHIHPESIVHSLVAYEDGSILAQMGSPDMRTPIAYGLAWPERIDAGVEPLDLFDIGQLNFSPPDRNRFPCLKLAEQAFALGGTAPAVLNALNEVAVQAFLDEKIRFTDIPILIDSCMELSEFTPGNCLEEVYQADSNARLSAESWLKEHHV